MGKLKSYYLIFCFTKDKNYIAPIISLCFYFLAEFDEFHLQWKSFFNSDTVKNSVGVEKDCNEKRERPLLKCLLLGS